VRVPGRDLPYGTEVPASRSGNLQTLPKKMAVGRPRGRRPTNLDPIVVVAPNSTGYGSS
jgi:hypothetical protein